MKLFLHYEEPDDTSAHKTLKLTLPKSWRTGPTLKILQQFVESYNQALPSCPALDSSLLHLTLFRVSLTAPAQERIPAKSSFSIGKKGEEGVFDPIPYDAITCKALSDQDHVYVKVGPSLSMLELGKSCEDEEPTESQSTVATTTDSHTPLVRCTHFGCKVRFPKGSLDTPKPCIHHAGPPVFHETAKFWSCCPQKRAYDWDDFENIPGCVVDEAGCTEVPKTNTRNFLGGCDLRADAGEKNKLKSIEEFNQSQRAAAQGGGGGSHGIRNTIQDEDGGVEKTKTLLIQLRDTLILMGLEEELFDQIVEGIRKQLETELSSSFQDTDDLTTVLEKAVVEELGKKLKKAFKAMAVEQLRIK